MLRFFCQRSERDLARLERSLRRRLRGPLVQRQSILALPSATLVLDTFRRIDRAQLTARGEGSAYEHLWPSNEIPIRFDGRITYSAQIASKATAANSRTVHTSSRRRRLGALRAPRPSPNQQRRESRRPWGLFSHPAAAAFRAETRCSAPSSPASTSPRL